MFHMYTIFHQMISLYDTTLRWECHIFHVWIIQHYVDAGFNGQQCKQSKVPVLLVEGNYQPFHIFFSFLVSLFSIFFREFLDFLGTLFYDIPLVFPDFLGTLLFDNSF